MVTQNRQRKLSVGQLNIDWMKIGEKMLAAEAKDPRNATSIRAKIAEGAGLSEAVARRVKRMVTDFQYVEKHDAALAKQLRLTGITQAEVIMRWARFDLKGARKAAAEFAAGQHTVVSLRIAEKASRASKRSARSTIAFTEVERSAMDRLTEDPRFAGWGFWRLAAESDFTEHGLDPTLAQAGVDAIARHPDARNRLLMIFQSSHVRVDAQFSRTLLQAAWVAAGVGLSTQSDVWIVVTSPVRYLKVEALIERLSVAAPVSIFCIEAAALADT
jgi:F0F1-type ATP synthase membrane subunit c/vacuolar-type H+-ATPase subunit K